MWFFYAFVFIKYTTNYDNFRLLRFINHYGCFVFVGVVYDLLVKVRKCNNCLREKDISKFRKDKLTCIKCEYRFKQRWLRSLVKERRLTPTERLANRFGYMGTAFIMLSPYLLPYDNIGAYTYIIGACLSIPQVFVAKQWNLVIVNLNLLVGYGAYIFN